MATKKTTKVPSSTIALNRQAKHDFFIEDRIEAGLALQGWEVKSLRDGKLNLKESYVTLKNGEAYLFGAHITPLSTASTHIRPDPTRLRKLLMHRRQLDMLIGMVDRKGYTVVPMAMYWSKGRAKLEVGLGKGKKQHDKRATTKEREWNIDKQRIMKHSKR